MSDLVARVAKVVACANLECDDAKPGELHRRIARAVIAVVLEEAAKVAEYRAPKTNCQRRPDRIAAAIRALAGEEG